MYRPDQNLDDTAIAQPAILVTSIAALKVMGYLDYNPNKVAGHSLGEYAASVAAGSLGSEVYRIIQARGEYMTEAGKENPGGMAALLKLDLVTVEEICGEAGCQIANINSEDQIIVSGRFGAVERAVEMAREKGGRGKGLAVSIAGHSKLMLPAQRKLATLLAGESIADPRLDFIANLTADYVRTGEVVRRCLIEQMTGRVLWLDTIRRMVADGVNEIIEVGPGKVLTNISKRICPDLKTDYSDRIIQEIS